MSAAKRFREFKDGDDQFIVRLRLDEPFRNNPATMGDLLIPSGTRRIVKVSDVAALKSESGPASIDRYNRQRQISVHANSTGCRWARCSRRRK